MDGGERIDQNNERKKYSDNIWPTFALGAMAVFAIVTGVALAASNTGISALNLLAIHSTSALVATAIILVATAIIAVATCLVLAKTYPDATTTPLPISVGLSIAALASFGILTSVLSQAMWSGQFPSLASAPMLQIGGAITAALATFILTFVILKFIETKALESLLKRGDNWHRNLTTIFTPILATLALLLSLSIYSFAMGLDGNPFSIFTGDISAGLIAASVSIACIGVLFVMASFSSIRDFRDAAQDSCTSATDLPPYQKNKKSYSKTIGAQIVIGTMAVFAIVTGVALAANTTGISALNLLAIHSTSALAALAIIAVTAIVLCKLFPKISKPLYYTSECVSESGAKKHQEKIARLFLIVGVGVVPFGILTSVLSQAMWSGQFPSLASAPMLQIGGAITAALATFILTFVILKFIETKALESLLKRGDNWHRNLTTIFTPILATLALLLSLSIYSFAMGLDGNPFSIFTGDISAGLIAASVSIACIGVLFVMASFPTIIDFRDAQDNSSYDGDPATKAEKTPWEEAQLRLRIASEKGIPLATTDELDTPPMGDAASAGRRGGGTVVI